MENQSWHCVAYGMGYSASHWARRLLKGGVRVGGLTRDVDKLEALLAEGMQMLATDKADEAAFATVTHLLISVPPSEGHAQALERIGKWDTPDLQWIGYLSSTGVYGDCGGDWVDETTPPNPHDARTQGRLAAEQDWQVLADAKHVPLHIFRLGGIYGPGRNALEQVKAGKARRIIKPGVQFSRIHVEDIATSVILAMHKGRGDQIYNCCDDVPSEAKEVITYACHLLDVKAPPLEPFETAELTPMMRSFYAANRRVKNTKLKTDLGMEFAYPSYKEGLTALLALQNNMSVTPENEAIAG
jgi:nucleoside-diphosphate-sugar epimerase